MDGRHVRLGIEAERQWGAFTRRQCLDAGWSNRAIDRNVAVGRWQRIHADVYCDAKAPRSPQMMAMAAVLAAAVSAPIAAVSHVSALAAHGLLQSWPGRPHVAVPHANSPELDRVHLHRSTDLVAADVTDRAGIPVTTVVRTLVDTARMLAPNLHALCLDEAVRTGMYAIAALAARATELRRPGRSGPAQVLELVGTRPAGAGAMDSCLEILLARHLGPSATAGWVHHHVVYVPGTPRHWEIDFAFPDARVSVEADGAQHGGFGQACRDGRRDADLALLGWTQVRCTWAEITRQPDLVLRRIRRALGAQRDGRARLGAHVAP